MHAWEAFLAKEESELGKETVDKWLRTLQVRNFDACNLYLEAKDPFQAMWFEEHVRKKVQAYLVNNNKKKIKVHLLIPNRGCKKPQRNKAKASSSAPPTPPPFHLTFDDVDPNCTFDSFHTTEDSLLPFKLLSKMCGFDSVAGQLLHAPTELGGFNPIYISGPSGSGKTHLIMSVVQALRQQGLRVIFARAETFTEHVVTAIRAGEMRTFRETYRNIDILAIDNIQVLSRKSATQEELFHTFNTLHLAGKQILLGANCIPSSLSYVEPRLVSRFEWGIVLPLEKPVKKDLTLILKKKTEKLNFPLHPKVVEFLVENFGSGTKSLCKALEGLMLRCHMNPKGATSTQLTPTLAKHYLADLLEEEQKNALTPEIIIAQVAEHYTVTKEDLLGKAQTREYVQARQMAMYLCRQRLKMPFLQIGHLFSKDHSTVMSSVKSVQKSLDENNNETQFSYQSISKKLSE